MYLTVSVATCIASSLVGTRTKIRGPLPLEAEGSTKRLSEGNMNAAVLPVPV